MPELPEVEITKISLSKQILHKKVKNVTILNPKLRYKLNKQNLLSLKNDFKSFGPIERMIKSDFSIADCWFSSI